jgi:PAS domain S-box-containing protein
MQDPKQQLNSFALDTREDLVINAIEIFDTIKQSLMILDGNLCVVMANSSFYKTFCVTREETEGKLIYDIGNGQWAIPQLKTFLENIIPKKNDVDDYEVNHEFDHLGEKAMLLNAREVIRQDNRKKVILLAIEDITQKKQLEKATQQAEVQINSILENLVDSAERYSGGTAPHRKKKGSK